jgi:hypothetical protein
MVFTCWGEVVSANITVPPWIAMSVTSPAETTLPRPSGAAMRFSTERTSSCVTLAISKNPYVSLRLDRKHRQRQVAKVEKACHPAPEDGQSSASSNHGFRFNQPLLRQEGCGSGNDCR